MNVFARFKMLRKVPIELLHLIAGFALVLSGGLVFFIDGFEMALSWIIFGAMYVSMSDIGETKMSLEEQHHLRHKLRRLFGYAGSCGSIALLGYYFSKLLF